VSLLLLSHDAPSPSCVDYNPYHKHYLVSSDYEGCVAVCVCVWDTNVGRRTNLHQVCLTGTAISRGHHLCV
jgi:hypothetical protein